MGCGRVGILLTQELAKAGHDVTVIDKNAAAFDRLPPGFEARTIVGLGFDREVLEEAGIKEADAFLAVSSGDNSNIVSARVAREHYHVPKVIARIYDPMRADIYERLNIPTVSTTRWGVKQMKLMLTHPGEEIKETLAGGRPLPDAGSRSLRTWSANPSRRSTSRAKILVAGRRPWGQGVHPGRIEHLPGGRLRRSDRPEGRARDARRAPPAHRRSTDVRVVISGAGAVGRHLAGDLAKRGHSVTLIEQNPDVLETAKEWAPGVDHHDRRRVRTVGPREGCS